LPRGSDDLQDNISISRQIARPTLVGIEGDNAQNAWLPPENALDDGPLVSPDLVYLAPCSAVLTEVLKDCVDGQVLRRP